MVHRTALWFSLSYSALWLCMVGSVCVSVEMCAAESACGGGDRSTHRLVFVSLLEDAFVIMNGQSVARICSCLAVRS